MHCILYALFISGFRIIKNKNLTQKLDKNRMQTDRKKLVVSYVYAKSVILSWPSHELEILVAKFYVIDIDVIDCHWDKYINFEF